MIMHVLLLIWAIGAVLYFVNMFVISYISTLGYSHRTWVVIPFMLFLALTWPVWVTLDYVNSR